MIRQLCPHCLKLAELPDSAAGSTINCPSCAKSFQVPSNYSPNVDPQAGPGNDPRKASDQPPPGLVVPASQAVPTPASAAPTPTPPAAPAPADTTYPKTCGITLSPKVLEWIPVGCFTLIVLMTIFPWIGSYPGGTRVYSQYPWQAIFGNFERNTALEDLLKDEAAIEAKIGWNLWLMIYLPLLLAVTFLAWLERLIHDPKPDTVPPLLAWLPNIWHVRYSLLTGLSLLVFVILAIQDIRGFSLETAIKQTITEKFADDAAKATTTPAKQRLSVQIGQELAMKGVQGTLVLNFVIFLHLTTIVVMALRWWEHQRGAGKPAPWIGIRF